MIYRIHINAAAAVDLVNIHDYLAEKSSPEVADRDTVLLEKAIASLSEFPRRYALAPEAAIHNKEVRHIVVGKYRVLFMIIMETVDIVRIRHISQEPVPPGELN